MVERSDEEMILRLIGQIKLLIAMNDEISVEKQLESQAMLKQFEGIFSVPSSAQNPLEVRDQYDTLYIELSEHADLDALLRAMRNFSPFIE